MALMTPIPFAISTSVPLVSSKPGESQIHMGFLFDLDLSIFTGVMYLVSDFAAALILTAFKSRFIIG